jgi:acetyl esterase/lipase
MTLAGKSVPGSAELMKLKSAAMVGRTIAEVCARRMVHGPRHPSWNLHTELASAILKRQLQVSFKMHDVARARRYLDALPVPLEDRPSCDRVEIRQERFSGSWSIPKHGKAQRTVLYLHGGGYSFYPRGFYENFAGLLGRSTEAAVFSLDYGLAPEHRFPSQLTEAVNAFQWLLKRRDLRSLVLIGDSAGGNLALALLLRLRAARLPFPALTVCLSPATDFRSSIAIAESPLDWITPHMALRWAEWYCTPEQCNDPLVSPVLADLRGLPTIYVQAGEGEILFDSIQSFVSRAQAQGVQITLDAWPGMNHDFQAFGPRTLQSAEALKRIGAKVAEHVPGRDEFERPS